MKCCATRNCFCRSIIVAILVLLDLAFLISVSLLCDRLSSRQIVAGFAYTATLLLFLFRMYNYLNFVRTIILYYRAKIMLPLPYSELRPWTVVLWYSALTVWLLVTSRDTCIVDVRVQWLVGVWAAAVFGNAISAWRCDDRVALRKYVGNVLARKQRHESRQRRVMWAATVGPDGLRPGDNNAECTDDDDSDDEFLDIDLDRRIPRISRTTAITPV